VNSVTVVDTGPLVAFLNRRDTHHKWSCVTLGVVRPPLLTCEAVLSEACFLLRHTRGGAQALLALLERGLLRTSFCLAEETKPVSTLLKKYSDIPMSLADGCLVRMSELLPRSVLVTTDADFKVYRRLGRLTIPTLMPPGL
jgi:predicted nucleic acid-binding protein